MNIPDPLDLFLEHDRDREEWLESRPVCDDCGEHIQEDHYYRFNDEIICPDCIDNYRVDIDEYD